MSQSWSAFLQEDGAQLDSERRIAHFGDPEGEREAALQGPVVADLSARFALLEVSGADAEQFLQGQFTNDVRQVTPGHCQLSAWCTHKGRVIVSFYLLAHESAYYLLLPHEQLPAVQKRLQMFVLRSQVQLRDASADKVCFAVAGDDGGLSKHSGQELPDAPYSGVYQDGVSLFRFPGTARFLVFAAQDKAGSLWTALRAEARAVSFDSWQLLDILAGIPLVGAASAEAFVPQMLNFQALGGVNFKKGCYTGQEVVARSQYLGKIKRSLYIAHLETDPAPQEGEALFTPEGEEAGKIVNTQPHPEGGYVLLAVLKRDLVEQGAIHHQDGNGAVLAFMDLPYALQ